MEQDNVLDKIDDLIETNNYKKLYTYNSAFLITKFYSQVKSGVLS